MAKKSFKLFYLDYQYQFSNSLNFTSEPSDFCTSSERESSVNIKICKYPPVTWQSAVAIIISPPGVNWTIPGITTLLLKLKKSFLSSGD